MGLAPITPICVSPFYVSGGNSMLSVQYFKSERNIQLVSGIFFVVIFASAAWQISQMSLFTALGISPLIVGILFGIVYGNTLRQHMPDYYVGGISYSSKTLLRFAIILYGFRLTFQDLLLVGLDGFAISAFMLVTTFVGGSWLGIKLFKLPRRLAFLTASGSAVCGAAAVLATEPVVKGRNYESSIAVGTVVVFGTVSMFIYPFLYSHGFLDMTIEQYGAYVGGTLHEVAHVVAAGQAVSPEAGNIAVIVKMMRVILIAPLLISLGYWLRTHPDFTDCDDDPQDENACRGGKYTFRTFPWFAVLFIVCVGFNSLHLLPQDVVNAINTFDIFLLTMAMCALGIQTSIKQIREVGPRPFLLAALLAVWLGVGGYYVTKLVIV